MWKAKKIEKSTKFFDKWTLVFFKNGRIFAASKDTDVVELNMNLEVVKKFKGRNSQPLTIDANENYLVVGYEKIDSTGYVDVHSKTELDQNGAHGQRTVRTFLTLSSIRVVLILYPRNISMTEVWCALLSKTK